MRQYRIEGKHTTRWYADKHEAMSAYNRRWNCCEHVPGDVYGDAHEPSASAVYGVRNGHATITLRMREVENKNPAAVALGSITTPKKAASRENGRLGGRPRVAQGALFCS